MFVDKIVEETKKKYSLSPEDANKLSECLKKGKRLWETTFEYANVSFLYNVNFPNV